MTEVAFAGSVRKVVQEVDIIWNITLVCPWDCKICCVDAVQVTQRNGSIQIRSSSLTKLEQVPYQQGMGTLYEQAMVRRQREGLELDFRGKLRILDHLEGFLPKLDFSGGDPMSVSENFEVMRIASQRFGKQQITLTATGAGLARHDPEKIAPLVGELNFTYDNVSKEGTSHRPAGYADGNLRKAAQFAAAGVKTRGECPLTRQNINDDCLRQLYIDLHTAGVDKLLLMRLFPVGRGVFKASDVPTASQYRRAIHLLRDMEAELKRPVVKLQCALKYFDRQDMIENPCDLVHKSFGLMSNGMLLASPWAVDPHSKPLDDAWVLGNLSTSSLYDILASDKVQEYRQHLDDNFGECKIHAFLNSTRKRSPDRIFDQADPLYRVATSRSS